MSGEAEWGKQDQEKHLEIESIFRIGMVDVFGLRIVLMTTGLSNWGSIGGKAAVPGGLFLAPRHSSPYGNPSVCTSMAS